MRSLISTIVIAAGLTGAVVAAPASARPYHHHHYHHHWHGHRGWHHR